MHGQWSSYKNVLSLSLQTPDAVGGMTFYTVGGEGPANPPRSPLSPYRRMSELQQKSDAISSSVWNLATDEMLRFHSIGSDIGSVVTSDEVWK